MSAANTLHSPELLSSHDLTGQIAHYTEFLNVFGSPLVDDRGETASRVLLPPRALHFDEHEVAMHFLAVHSHVRRRTLLSEARRDPMGNRTHQFIYDTRHFRVATCDGQGITDWQVVGARATHYGPVDHLDNQFDPNKLEMALTVTHPTDPNRAMLDLRFWPASQMGTMELSPDRLGWILDELGSRQRQEQLVTAAATLGYAALAS